MQRRNERGQVIILLVAGLITLLGFTALAIDGARLLSEKRNLQGVADTAALTAATYLGQYTRDDLKYYFSSIEPRAEAAALERIRSNGYTDAAYDPYNINDWLYLQAYPMHPGDPYTPYLIEVKMVSEVDPIFAQLIYNDRLMANAFSQVTLMPPTNAAYGNAIYATAPTGDRRIEFIGNGDLTIDGAGVFANSSDSQAVYVSGSAESVIDGTVSAVGGVDYVNGDMTSDGIINNAAPLPYLYIPTPADCADLNTSLTIYDSATGITYHTVGRITSKTVITGGEHVYQSGWYCVLKDFQINGGIVRSADGGLMFYFPNANTSFTTTGGVIDLRAAQDGEADDTEGHNWDGMLIYIAESNIGVFAVQGNGGSHLEGTVYAPGPPANENLAKCSLAGSGMTDTYNLQFICYSIELQGSAGLNMVYDASIPYDTEPQVNVEE